MYHTIVLWSVQCTGEWGFLYFRIYIPNYMLFITILIIAHNCPIMFITIFVSLSNYYVHNNIIMLINIQD